MNTWHPFKHKLLRLWRQQRITGDRRRGSDDIRLGLALSGGADSVALVHALYELRGVLRLELVVLHLHHGGEGTFRNQARDFCEQLAQGMELPFYTHQAATELLREAEMRDFRSEAFQRWQKELELDFIVTAHHADDLLETRLMRLIRGTGPQGFRAIRLRSGIYLRPFLGFSRHEILENLSEKQLIFLEDPSNQNDQYLRNWIRNEWLEKLEARSPGSKERMAHSMELLVERLLVQEVEWESSLLESGVFIDSRRLSRPHYKNLSHKQQKSLLALWLKKLGVRDYSSAQIEEIRKQLDTAKNEHRFIVSGLKLSANAKQIEAVFETGTQDGPTLVADVVSMEASSVAKKD